MADSSVSLELVVNQMAAFTGAAVVSAVAVVATSDQARSSFIGLAKCLVVALSPDFFGSWDGGASAVQPLRR